jgi:hypothetical protein
VTRAQTLARHVIDVHVNAAAHAASATVEGELSLDFLKKFIAFCREQCAPRLSAAGGEKLINNYVRLRNPPIEHNEVSDDVECESERDSGIGETRASIRDSDHDSAIGGGRSYE